MPSESKLNKKDKLTVSKRKITTSTEVTEPKKKPNIKKDISNPTKKSYNNAKATTTDPKEIKKMRQMARPHYDIVLRAKKLWNIIREKDVDKLKRQKLVKELLDVVKTKMYDIATKHDASRIIQSLLKYGNNNQRTIILNELSCHLVELSKLQYGAFLVLKIIKYCSNNSKNISLIVKVFQGNMVKLSLHNIASKVIEKLYEILPTSKYFLLLLELYGKEFTILHLLDNNNNNDNSTTSTNNSNNLTRILKQLDDEKKIKLFNNMKNIVNKMIEKQLLSYSFVHHFIYDYITYDNYNNNERLIELIPSLKDSILALVSTRYGSIIAANCVNYGDNKTRKRIMKNIKDKVMTMITHPNGYLVLLALFNVVDDTVLLTKTITSELLDHIYDISINIYGKKVLLQLLSPLNKRYLNPQEIQLLLPPKIIDKSVIENNNNTNEIKYIINYKKDPEIRRKEILKSGLKKELFQIIVDKYNILLKDKNGSDILYEMIVCISTNVFDNDESIEVIFNNLFNYILNNTDNILNEPIGHKTIQRLFSIDRFLIKFNTFINDKNDIKNKFIQICSETNRGGFVLLSFLPRENDVIKMIPENTIMNDIKEFITINKEKLEKQASSQVGIKLLFEKYNF